MEGIQYNVSFAITGAIRETLKEISCDGLGLKSLRPRRWYRKLCYFYKTDVNKSSC